MDGVLKKRNCFNVSMINVLHLATAELTPPLSGPVREYRMYANVWLVCTSKLTNKRKEIEIIKKVCRK